MSAQLHLVRHGEVFNPQRVLYGRLPGFGLSDLGREMAAAAADDLVARGRTVAALYSSPLERTRQSAEPISRAFDLEPVIDERLIEPTNRFEGSRLRGAGGALRNPANWPLLVNPWRPSWGEPFTSIARRMIAAMTDAASASDSDGDLVFVSHQLPIWMAHRSIVGARLAHDPRQRRCALSSITSFELQNGRLHEVGYADPAARLGAQATDLGAV
ncbi:broad specificity phosphatase PhoE [Agromyces atrinae]|uniref:Broad specificity phosphatase PhoE n=1 Tax=Agromyces atrinae TaxID=592376 RepID=A0A852S4M2_9MICO|nr:broad specificity phosphatase PhoE [Agromyces atrinae]